MQSSHMLSPGAEVTHVQLSLFLTWKGPFSDDAHGLLRVTDVVLAGQIAVIMGQLGSG